MRELFKQQQSQGRKPAKASRHGWEGHTRAEREGVRTHTASKPRRALEQAWRDAIDGLEEMDLPGAWMVRPVGKGRLR